MVGLPILIIDRGSGTDRKKAPILSGKAAPLGLPSMVWSALAHQLAIRRDIVLREVVGMSKMWREVVNWAATGPQTRLTTRRSPVGPRPNWLAQTRVLSTRMSVGAVETRQASCWRNGIRAWDSHEPTTYHPGSWDIERVTLAYSRWAGVLSQAIVGIGSLSLASLYDRMPVGNFMRWGQGLLKR